MEATFLFLLLRLTQKSDERKAMQRLDFEPSELFIPITVPLLSNLFAFSCLIFLIISFIFSSSEFWHFYLLFTVLIMRILIQNCWLCSPDIGQRDSAVTVLGMLATLCTHFEDSRICFAESVIHLSQLLCVCMLFSQ